MPEEILATKICTRCGEAKNATTVNFSPMKRGPLGLQVWCKPCCAEQKRQARAANPERFAEIERARHLRDGDSRRAGNREYHAENRDVIVKRMRERAVVKAPAYNKIRRERLAADPVFAEATRKSQRDWLAANADRVREWRRETWAKMPKHKKLRTYIGVAVSRSLRGKSKGGAGWQTIVGYKVSELIAHLESKFVSGMTWANYGDWHIDHIRPVSSFDIRGVDEELVKCWALSNLQPLWALDNIRKGAKLDWKPNGNS